MHPETADQMYECVKDGAADLQCAWDQLSSMLPGKKREVVLECEVSSF